MEAIDVHVHTTTEKCEELIDYAKNLNIVKVCILGDVLKYGYNQNEEQVKEINDLTIFLTKKYPDFFIGFCYINPRNSIKFIEQEIERCILKNNLSGIKLEASTFASDKIVFPICDIAVNLNIPLLQHSTSTLAIGRNPIPFCYQTDPDDIVVLAKNFPKLTIISAHLRGVDIRGIISYKKFENIFVDTSGGQPIRGVIEYAVEIIGSERILYGSDVYFPYGRDFPVQLNAVIGSDIKTKDKENILFKNAKRILKI
ncbi:MAG: amidohydrolase family protein [Candidatus Omnitrophica bacterium]|nr:amidohydrolase family protein [Candidatus Omnitrophota bacterium]